MKSRMELSNLKRWRITGISIIVMFFFAGLFSHSPELNAGFIPVGYALPKISVKYGAVYTREIVRDADGNPIYVEYDAAGNEVAGGLNRSDTPQSGYQVMSGQRYRAILKQYQDLLAAYETSGLDAPELLDKESYQASSFVALDGTTITQPALREESIRAVVAPLSARFSSAGDQLLLLELPIDPQQTISESANSLLMVKESGQIIHETTNNIGYRVGFYGNDTTVSTSTERQADDKIFGPLKYVPVDMVSFDAMTQTDDQGKYRLQFFMPPCPGFSYELNSLTAVQLRFKRFYPTGSPTKPYSLFHWGVEGCYGHTDVSLLGPFIDIQAQSDDSISVTNDLDFPIDIMVVSGHAVLANDLASIIPVGQTTYDASRSTLERVAQQNYDMDGDGISETTILGRLETDIEGVQTFIKSLSPESAEVQGVWLSSLNSTPGFEGDVTYDLPYLTRLPDWSTDSEDRALLSEISAEDLADTDLYVFRESDGSLLMERKGLSESEIYLGVDTIRQKFAYTLRLVGSRGRLHSGTVGEGDNAEFQQWQMAEGVVDNSPLYTQQADHLRPGEKVRIIAINRATGYLGSHIQELQAAGNGGTNLEISFNVDDIILLPPNLKVWAERQSRTELGMTQGEINKYLVGSEGAGMSGDQFILIYTEWLDPDGLPLPEELGDYGYTARLARIVSENTLDSVDMVDNVPVKPGKQLSLIRLPEVGEGVGNEHYYVQVSGQPHTRESDFSSGNQTAMLQHRPNKFVPLLAPVYDEDTTQLAIQTWNSARLNDSSLKRPEPIYKWRYRPEYQFSVYDLQVDEINREDVLGETQNILNLEQPVISSSDEALQLLYDLTGPGSDNVSLNTLDAYSYGEEKELVFAFGEQEVKATVDGAGNISFDDPSQLSSLSAEDYLSIRLYANNDPENVLWEWAAQRGLFEGVTKNLFVKRDVDILNDRSCLIGSSFHFYLTRAALVNLRFVPSDSSGGREYVVLNNTQLQPGNYSFPIDSNELEPGEYTSVLNGVELANGYSEMEQGAALSELSTQDRLPVGHMIVKGVDLYDGHLTHSSEDFSIAGRGKSLDFTRSYGSNAGGKPGVMGVGWSHNWDTKIVNHCGEYMVIGAEGGGIRFVEDGEGNLTPLKGYHGTLLRDNGAFDFYPKGGNRYHYVKQSGETEWLLSYVSDTNGNTTSLSYDTYNGERYLSKVTDSAGRDLVFSYVLRPFSASNFVGNFRVLSRIEAVDGISVDFSYDDFGNMIRASRDGTERVESYTYNTADTETPLQSRHTLIAYTNPNDSQTTYTYNPKTVTLRPDGGAIIEMPYRAVASISEPTGISTRFSYSAAFPSTSTVVVDPNGNNTTYALNSYGSATGITDPVGTTSMTWSDTDVVMLSRTDANGVTTEYTYDEHANVLSEKTGSYTRAYSYAAFADKPWIKNRRASESDRNGNITTYTYDGSGNVIKVVDALGGTTLRSYNSSGDLVTSRDANSHTTSFAYDSYGNLTAKTDPLGNVSSAQWDVRSRQNESTDANGKTTSFSYDTLDHLIAQTNALSGNRNFSYDAMGNKLSQQDELGRNTSWAYDGLGRLIAETNPMGVRRNFSYDSNGNKLSESDWNNNVTNFVYDAGNRLTKRTEPLGRTTLYAYDAVGNLTAETDANNHTTNHRYDALNRPIEITDALGGVTVQLYDGENLNSVTDALNHTTTYTYDALNRRIKVADAANGISLTAYDAVGNKVSVTDANGHQSRFGYDAANRLTSQIDAEGNTTGFSYDANANLLSQTDARGNVNRYSYDALNRKLTTTDASGNVTSLSYDAVGNLLTEQWPNTNAISHSYDRLNRLTQSSDSLGTLAAYGYDANGNKTAETDANGNSSSHQYDALNRLTQSVLPAARTLSFGYDTLGNRTSDTDANGNTTRYSYDALNRLTATTDPLGSTTSRSYDAVGNLTSESDKNGNTTSHNYDPLNRLLSTSDALGNSISMSYDAVGNTLTTTDKRGTLSAFSYDGNNRLLTTTKAGQLLETLSYDAVGNTASTTDANGNTVSFSYDARNLLSKLTTALGLITSNSYDAMGDRLSVTDPSGRTSSWSYDKRRRTASETNGAGESTTYGYDANGNRTSKTRPNGNGWQYRYDAANRLATITDPLSGTTTYSYDGNSNRLSQQDANGYTTRFDYDALNRKSATNYADGGSEAYRYDANDNLTTLTDARGQSILYAYDVLNRKTLATYPTTGATDELLSIATSYDANGNPTAYSESYSGDSVRQTTRAYDDYDRLTQVTDGFGRTIAYSYDANGNRTGLTDPDNIATAYRYDADNRLSQVTTGGGVTGYSYDGSGQIIQISNPNTTVTRQGHDSAGRLTTISHGEGANTLAVYSYSYDANGNRLTQSETQNGITEHTTYGFDNADRMTSAAYPDKTVSYSYDANYNRLSETTTASGGTVSSDKSYSYNSRNQLTAITDALDAAQSTSYQYDANGNQTIKSKNGVTTTFIYDARDKLLSVVEAQTTLGQFRYDYQGMRIEKRGDGGLIRYSYDGDSVLTQSDEAGSTVAKYEYGASRLLSLNNSSEGRRYYHHDALGSVIALSDSAGQSGASYRYDAWGNSRETTGQSDNPFGFTGHEKDDETGLYYFKARFYDPDTGRFIGQDSYLGEGETPPSLHRYLYAYSNPTVWVDLDGHLSTEGASRATLEALKTQTGRTVVMTGAEAGAPAAVTFCASGVGTFLCVVGGLIIPNDNIMSQEEEMRLLEQDRIRASGSTLDGTPYDPDTREGRERFAEDNPGVTDARAGTAPAAPKKKEDAQVVVEGHNGLSNGSVSIEPPSQNNAPTQVGKDDYEQALDRPGYWRKKTTESVESKARNNENGEFICPTCGVDIPKERVVQTKNGPKTERGHHFDHYPETNAEIKERLNEEWLSRENAPTLEEARKEYLDEYQNPDNLRVQCPECNISHEFEGKKGEYEEK